jgi:DNA-binding CsgD family transcriptional regulator
MAPAELVGRSVELQSVGAFLADRSSNVLLIEGAAGIGKTTVWRAGLQHARELGHRVLVTRPLEGDRARSFTGLTDLLGDAFDETREDLPRPQRRALEVALGRDDTGDSASAGALSAAALALLRAASRGRPVLVAVDDLQWLDRPTHAILCFVARRLDTTSLRTLATLRTGAGPTIADDEGRMLVGPLGLEALTTIVSHELGHGLPRPTLRRIERMAGGNAFVALELARAAEAGRLRSTSADVELDLPQIRRLVGDRLAALPRASLPALATVAALADPTTVAVHAAVERESLLDPAFEAGVLEESGTETRFSHPLLAAAALASVTPRRRREIHARLAAIVEDPEQRARHLAAATVGYSAPVAEALDAACAQASRRGAPGAAAELSEKAAALTPGEDVEAHGERLMTAGECYEQTGNARRALELFRQAAAELPPGPGHARALMFVGSHEHMGLEEGVTLGRAAVAESGDDREVRVFCLLAHTLGLELTGRMHEARDRAEEALGLVGDDGDRDLRIWALATTAQLDSRMEAGAGRATLREAMSQEGDRLVPMPDLSPATSLARAYVWADELDEGRALLRVVHARASAAGDEAGLADMTAHLALLECRAGRLEAARAHAAEALALCDQGEEVDQCFGAALHPRALVAAMEGDEDLALRLSERGLRIAEQIGDRVSALSHRCALGFVELSRGDATAALEHLDRLPGEVASIGIGEPGLFPFHGDLLEALISASRHEEAAAWASTWSELGRRIDRARLLCVCARARAMLASARDEHADALRELERALVLHDRLGDPFERGRTLLVLGGVRRRLGQRRAARDVLQEAVALFDDVGAATWAARGRTELGRISGRRREGTDALTATEDQVAELVAEGRTNREVAEELFISVRTVESNLTRIYAKLGLRSRTELASRYGALTSWRRR